MAKLQLHIAKSHRGYQPLADINLTEDVRRHIFDLRTVLETIDYDLSVHHVFLHICYLDSGVLFSILSTIGDKTGDHIAATLFIPRDTHVDAASLTELTDVITGSIAGGRLAPEAVEALREVLAHDYITDDEAPDTPPSQGRTPGVLFYGDGDNELHLADIMGEKRYQPAFLPYSGVLLVDRSYSDVSVRSGNEVHLTHAASCITLLPPAMTAEGFSAHVYRRPFTRPILVEAGKDISVSWHHAGFEQITSTVHAKNNPTPCPVADTSKARKAISPASFYITGIDKPEILADCTVRVNGTVITEPTYFTFHELSAAKVEITAPGHFPYSGNFNLASTTQALVQMRELRKIYRFELPVGGAVEQGKPVKFEIHSRKELTGSPVEGYEVEGADRGIPSEGTTTTNRLVYTGGRGRSTTRMLILAAVAGLIVGFAGAWLALNFTTGARATAAPAAADTIAMAPDSSVNDIDPPAIVETAPKIEETESLNTQAAIDYLDNNKTWSRAEMSEIGNLAGLFDDMNNYRMQRIIDYWGKELKGSKSVAALVAAAEGSKSKRNPACENHAPTYNPDSTDTRISWRAYTYWIDP